MLRSVFCAAAADNIKAAAVDGQIGFGLDAVAGTADDKAAAVNFDPTLGAVLGVACLNTILFGGEGESTVENRNRVLAAQGMACLLYTSRCV